MPLALIEISTVFNDEYTFPWEFLGMDRPRVGPLHSYLCEALSDFVGPEHRPYFKSRPTLSELRRRTEEIQYANQIVAYCDGCEGDTGSTAYKTVQYLRRLSEVRNFLEKKIDEKIRSGAINPPHRFLTLEGSAWLIHQKR